MRNKIYVKFAALFCAALFLGACSSCSEAGSDKANSNSKTKVVTPKEIKTGNQSNSNSNTNVTLKRYPGLEEGKNPTLDPSKVKKVDMSKVKKGIPAKKMPGNSELTTTMRGRDFLETRRFLNHPELEKIERLSKSAKDVEVTVFLRNGKKIRIEDGKLKNYKTDSAETILAAVGIKPKKEDPAVTRKKKEEALKAKPIRKNPGS